MESRRRERRPFWFLRRRARDIDADLDEEFEAHLEMRTEALVRNGRTVDDARREALRQFGDRARARHYCRRQDLAKSARTQRRLEAAEWLRDVRLCLRGLVRAPALALTIVLTVGAGIGVTTAIWTAVDAVLLQPLPYPDAAKLVRIHVATVNNSYGLSVADYLTLQREQTTLAGLTGYIDRSMTFAGDAAADTVDGRVVTTTYFDVLGLAPEIGRTFTPADALPESPQVTVVSHQFWTDRLGGRADVIGRTVTFDGGDYVLVGVLPRTVGPLENRRQFFLPARWSTPQRRGPFFITAIGRLRHDDDRPRVLSEFRAITTRMFPVWQSSYQDDQATWALEDLKTFVIGDVRTIAELAIAAVGLLWLITCVNASSLLVARLASRRREMALRVALGASRLGLSRLLLAESTLLALGSAALGLAFAETGIELLRGVGDPYLPRVREIAFNLHTLATLGCLTAISALLFGLPSIFHAVRGPLARSLHLSGRTFTEGSTRGRRLLVAVQIAITTPLVVVATLLFITLNRLEHVDPGFETAHLVTASVQLPQPRYQDERRVEEFWRAFTDRVAAIPGVLSAATADGRPMSQSGNSNNFLLQDHPPGPGQPQPVSLWVWVSPEYFGTLGQTVLDGRLFDARDADNRVVIVDRAWARKFFPGEHAVGKRLKSGGCTACPWTTVVGVVSDVKFAALDQRDEGTVYAPLIGQRLRYLVARTGGNSGTVAGSLKEAVRDVDRSAALSGIATMNELMATSLDVPRSLSVLIGTTALSALFLSMVGVYGVMAHHVARSGREMCIRLALGGTPVRVASTVITHAMIPVAAGAAVGLALAPLATHAIAGLLFGVDSLNPWTFLGAAVLICLAAALACAVPAVRAVRLDPMRILGSE